MMHKILEEDSSLNEKYELETNSREWDPRYKYELYGIVSHSGSLSYGHYIAIVSYKVENKRHWIYFSDSKSQNITEEKALSTEAYLLFYRRIFT